MKATKLTKDLNNEAFLQFALPKGGRGYVTQNGDLYIVREHADHCGYFTYHQDDEDNCLLYSFVTDDGLKEGEVIEPDDNLMSKDLFAFAVKLGYFFDNQTDEDDYQQLVFQPIDNITYPLVRVKLKPFNQGVN